LGMEQSGIHSLIHLTPRTGERWGVVGRRGGVPRGVRIIPPQGIPIPTCAAGLRYGRTEIGAESGKARLLGSPVPLPARTGDRPPEGFPDPCSGAGCSEDEGLVVTRGLSHACRAKEARRQRGAGQPGSTNIADRQLEYPKGPKDRRTCRPPFGPFRPRTLRWKPNAARTVPDRRSSRLASRVQPKEAVASVSFRLAPALCDGTWVFPCPSP
jgi:hypothetical protein